MTLSLTMPIPLSLLIARRVEEDARPPALRRVRQGRVLAGARIGEPLFPFGRVVRPLLHLDAPRWRLGRQEEGFALGGGQAARDGGLGGRHQRLSVRKDLPDPRRL